MLVEYWTVAWRRQANFSIVNGLIGFKLILQGDQLNITVFFVMFEKVTCPVYVTVHVYTEQVTFNKVPEITAMFNWSPCILFDYWGLSIYLYIVYF